MLFFLANVEPSAPLHSALRSTISIWHVPLISVMRIQNTAWQDGTLQGDITTAVAIAEDGSVVVVGNDREGNAGFQAAKLDADGTLLWEWEVICCFYW